MFAGVLIIDQCINGTLLSGMLSGDPCLVPCNYPVVILLCGDGLQVLL